MNGVKSSNEIDMTEALRTHYSTVYSENIPERPDIVNIENTIRSSLSNIPEFIVNFCENFSSLQNDDTIHFVSPIHIQEYLKDINSKKSAGDDEVSNYVLKKSSDLAIDYLTIIFNNCINNGYFPNKWKIGKIVPIKKSGSSNDVGNLRPISMLSNIGKLFEKVLRQKMDSNLDLNYIPDFQFGFKKEHSAVHALLKFHTDVISNLRLKQCTIAVSLDIEKAFDRVYHKGLVLKLIQLGFSPFIIRLLHSFLSDRVFFVQLNLTRSSMGSIHCGVPQGSLLAPHLYNIFVHDFPHECGTAKGILYADDSLIYSHNVSPVEALNEVKVHLELVSDYYKSWGIKINSSKSVAVCLRNASGRCGYKVVPESKTLTLSLNGENIPFKSSFKYLGVNFNTLFKFNYHARLAIVKCQKVKGMFSSLLNSKYLNIKTKLLIYKACIRPILMYAFPIWFACSPTVMKEIEILERKVLRLCVDRNFECYTRRFSNHFIYNKAKIIPFSVYGLMLMNRFIGRLSAHENLLLNSIFALQRESRWEDDYYLSPISFVNEDHEFIFGVDAPLMPDFFKKSSPNSHRG